MARKLTFAVILVVLVGVPASPAVLGWYTESAYRDAAAQLGAANPDVSVRIEAYERGWLSAEARYTIELGGPYADLRQDLTGQSGPIRITGRDRIRHGPVTDLRLRVARADSELRMTEFLRELGQDEIADDTVLAARSTVTPDGRLETRFHLVDHRIELAHEGERLALEWQDAGGRAEISAGVPSFLFVVPSLVMETGAGDRLELADLELGDRSHATPDGLRVGNNHVGFARLDIALSNVNAPDTLFIEQFALENEASVDDNMFRLSSLATFDRAVAGDVELREAELSLLLTGLRRAPLARLVDMLNRIQAEEQAASGELGVDRETQEELAVIVDELLSTSPELRAESMRVSTGEGLVQGELVARFDGDRAYDSATPITLVDPLNGHLELRLPRSLVTRVMYDSMRGNLPVGEFGAEMENRLRTQVQQTVNLLVGAGLIKSDGDDLIVRVDKEAGSPPMLNNQDIMAMIRFLSKITG